MGRASSAVAFGLALAGLTGCSSSGGPVTSRSTRGSAPPRAAVLNRCGSQVAGEPDLGRVRTARLRLPGLPDGVTASAGGRWAFASLQGSPGRIAVTSVQSFVPQLLRTISLPAGDVSGLALTHSGRLLIGASGRGAVVVSVARATRGMAEPMLGRLAVPGHGAAARGGAAEVAVSRDDRFAFVSLEAAGEIAVFDLRPAGGRAGRWGQAFVGTIPVGIAPLGIAVSPDGRRLYATSEQGRGAGHRQGTLSVIDVHRAETFPGGSVVATAPVPCHPVRVAVSPNGRLVWVTARTGNELLGFSAATLVSQPQHSLVAGLRVGEQPIGLGVVDGGRRVVVADSNLTGQPGATARLTVVDTAAALSGQVARVGAVQAGKLPSEIAVEANGHTLLVNNSASGQLEAVDVAQVP